MKTIRYCLFAVLLSVVALPASAQFWLGLSASIGAASMSYEDEGFDVETEGLSVFGVGLVAEKAMSDNLRILTNPAFQKKGTHVTESGSDFDIEATYIDLPILVKFLFGSGNLHPYVEGGVSINFLSKAEYDGEDIKDETKSTDFAGALGAGVEVAVGDRGAAFVGARYQLGLSNVADTEDVTVKNKLLGLIFGYKMQMGN